MAAKQIYSNYDQVWGLGLVNFRRTLEGSSSPARWWDEVLHSHPNTSESFSNNRQTFSCSVPGSVAPQHELDAKVSAHGRSQFGSGRDYRAVPSEYLDQIHETAIGGKNVSNLLEENVKWPNELGSIRSRN